MFSILRTAAVCAAAVSLTLAASPSGAWAQPAGHRDGGAYHIFATPSYEARTGHNPHLSLGEMEYFGGTVFTGVELVSVMWGSGVNSTTVAEIPDFSAAI